MVCLARRLAAFRETPDQVHWHRLAEPAAARVVSVDRQASAVTAMAAASAAGTEVAQIVHCPTADRPVLGRFGFEGRPLAVDKQPCAPSRAGPSVCSQLHGLLKLPAANGLPKNRYCSRQREQWPQRHEHWKRECAGRMVAMFRRLSVDWLAKHRWQDDSKHRCQRFDGFAARWTEPSWCARARQRQNLSLTVHSVQSRDLSSWRANATGPRCRWHPQMHLRLHLHLHFCQKTSPVEQQLRRHCEAERSSAVEWKALLANGSVASRAIERRARLSRWPVGDRPAVRGVRAA